MNARTFDADERAQVQAGPRGVWGRNAGSAPWPSGRTRRAAAFIDPREPRSLPRLSTAPLCSLGAPQSTQTEFPLAFRIAWMATASLWLSVRSCRKGWNWPDSPSEPFSGASDAHRGPPPNTRPSTLTLLLSQHWRLARI